MGLWGGWAEQLPGGPLEAGRHEGRGFMTHCTCLGIAVPAAWGKAQSDDELWGLLWANSFSVAFLLPGMGQFPEGRRVAQSWLLLL